MVFKSVSDALQDSFERSMVQMQLSKDTDKKSFERLQVLQQIFNHVKVGAKQFSPNSNFR